MNVSEPVFQQILGAEWHSLGEVIQRHYFLRPYSNDTVCISGTMNEIYHSRFAKLLIPFGLLFGAVVPYNAKDVPVDVDYKASKHNKNIYWDRAFSIKAGKRFHFRSHMEHQSGNDVIEFVRFGVGMRLKVSAEGGAIVFRDHGYIWRILNVDLPIPVGLIFGKAYVEERPAGGDTVRMKMELMHPLFGLLFRYHGTFAIPPAV
jgi:hypothetical protein